MVMKYMSTPSILYQRTTIFETGLAISTRVIEPNRANRTVVFFIDILRGK